MRRAGQKFTNRMYNVIRRYIAVVTAAFSGREFSNNTIILHNRRTRRANMINIQFSRFIPRNDGIIELMQRENKRVY